MDKTLAFVLARRRASNTAMSQGTREVLNAVTCQSLTEVQLWFLTFFYGT